ncbi:MAG TPA: DUF423 domain-containing protein [Pirellulales bacterium]|jgi:uncharacterized membrane protein YgdD (TMEM256/DUF423 family)|nr:DUF423 domain-containing protein [Pirellulales bacterium]
MAGRFWIACGAISAAIAVGAGAIGAHLLKASLSEAELQTFEVAVRYQMFHALGLVAIGLLVGRANPRWLMAAGIALALGTVLFSGGIYGWLLTGFKPLIHIVPLGGMAWIVGWLLVAWSACCGPRRSRSIES